MASVTRRRRQGAAVLGALLALAVALAVALSARAGAEDGGTKTLRFGWDQEPQTLNPFVDQDAVDFDVWSLLWDYTLNNSTKDLSPGPGIVNKVTVSKDKLTTTYKVPKGLKWSDGKPITSADVVYSLKVLGSNGLLFAGYTENVTSITAPDAYTVVVKTSKPDNRAASGFSMLILPKHVWGKVPVKELTGSYKVKLPMVGSGPWIVTKYQRGRGVTMERNPHFRGPKPKFDRIQFFKYGNDDAVGRALKSGEIDMNTTVEATVFKQVSGTDGIEARKSVTPSFTELAFNLCNRTNCPNAKFNPAVQDRAVRQALAYAVNRGRINQIAARNTSTVAYGILPQFYKVWYRKPKQSYPFDPAKANAILDDAGYVKGSDGLRHKGDVKLKFGMYTRSEGKYTTQAGRLVKEMGKKVGIEFDQQVVSTDKLTEILVRKEGGKPAPEFDTFVWGWGGDVYDPSGLLQLITTSQIGESSDSFYSNPTYDKLFDQQTELFDVAKRRKVVEKMVAIAQRDLPYLVLTVDPNLEAYRTERVSGLKPVCPEGDGDLICLETNYEPLVAATPGGGGGGGTSPAVWALAGIALLALLGLVWRILRRGRAQGKRAEDQLET